MSRAISSLLKLLKKISEGGFVTEMKNGEILSFFR